MNEDLLRDVIEMRGVGNQFHWSFFRGAGDVHCSPDGKKLAYVVNAMSVETSRAYNEIWIHNFSTGKAQRLTSALSDDSSPRFSPDGASLAFVSSRQGRADVWQISLDGGEARPLTDGKNEIACVLRDGCYFNLAWAPDGRTLYLTAAEPLPVPKEEPQCEVVRFGRGEGYGSFQHEPIGIWSLDLQTRTLRRVVAGKFDAGDFTLSPDGKSIVYLAGKDDEAPWFSTSKKFDLFRQDFATQETVKLTSNAGTNLNPRFSPNGKWIAYKSTPRLGTHNDVAQLMLLSTESGETKCLTPNFKYSPDALAQQCWSSDSRTVYFSAAMGCDNQLWRVGIDGAVSRPAQPNSFAIFLGAAAESERLVIQSASPALSPNLYASVRDRFEAVTEFNAELAARAPHQFELVRWSHADGTALEGVFFKPRDGRTPSPCIVIPHGGPHVRTPAVLTPDALVSLDAGYAVFLPNYRGSSGYGQEFIDADRGDWGGKDFEDILSGVDHLIAKGSIDANKLAIWGPSYGGFMTAWAIGQTDRFKAAVVFNGIINLFSWHGQTDYKAAIEWEFDGAPWENIQQVMQHSPIAHAGKVKTPTLIVYTDGDRRVPIAQGFELFTALHRGGVETEFLKYFGENHALNQPRHRQDYFRRVLAWLDKHCKGATS